MRLDRVWRKAAWVVGSAVIMVLCTGCAAEPSQRVVPMAAPPSPDINLYFYPAHGQSAQQQDRDKYECSGWAVQQSGFDPSAPNAPPHLRTVVLASPPPGAGIATGAVTGAVLGAAVSRPWEAGSGALLGALAGAAIGGIAESVATEEAQRQQLAASANGTNAQAARIEQQASSYRRAMSACLEGRGYHVN